MLSVIANILFANKRGEGRLLWLSWKRRKLLGNPKLLGGWGEKRSRRFLKRKGFRMLARNFNCRAGEIDLVMVDKAGEIIFVEVKTRADEEFEAVESAITKAKQMRIMRAARYFISTHNIRDRGFRFDVVAVVLGQKGPVEIRHYENAFG